MFAAVNEQQVLVNEQPIVAIPAEHKAVFTSEVIIKNLLQRPPI